MYGPVNRSARLRPAENEPRTAPTRISGAVSPSARDSARTVPVEDARASPTAGRACGRPASATHRCRSPPRGSCCGTARIASADVMITSGRIRTASVSPPVRTFVPLPSPIARQQRHEHGEAEQAVDDRRHARQVADVDVDEPRQAAGRRVFLEVDRGQDARSGTPTSATIDRQQRAADQALDDARLGRAARQRRGQEVGAALGEDRQRHGRAGRRPGRPSNASVNRRRQQQERREDVPGDVEPLAAQRCPDARRRRPRAVDIGLVPLPVRRTKTSPITLSARSSGTAGSRGSTGSGTPTSCR